MAGCSPYVIFRIEKRLVGNPDVESHITRSFIDRALRIAGILYVPDFVANAGGVIGGLQVDCGYDENESADRVSAIYDSVHAILDLATESGTSTNVAAERFARQVLDAN